MLMSLESRQRLSTGQAQLIAVARAISEKRRIIIVDEGNHP
jgi:ABC-type bacteriocin/lantibiotic exporter with double-glycine peptidase domain